MTPWSALAAWFRPRPVTPTFEADWAGLLARLGLPPHALRDVLATDALHPHFHYRHFFRAKKSGRREITEPDSKLKQVQQVILSRHLAGAAAHPAAVAYQKGMSIAHHAWAHAGAELLVTADVQDFFPNTRADRVADWWREQVVGDDLARLLALRTTYRGGLPQGAPTSPALSNVVNRALDERLAERAAATGGRYTRYCDDLAFSWPWGAAPAADFEAGVRATLHAFGYALHPDKGWAVHHRSDEPEVTGVILTQHGRVRLPDRLLQVMRRLKGSREPRDARRLEGYRGYQAMVTRKPGTRPRPQTPSVAAGAPRPVAPAPAPRPAAPVSDDDDDIPF